MQANWLTETDAKTLNLLNDKIKEKIKLEMADGTAIENATMSAIDQVRASKEYQNALASGNNTMRYQLELLDGSERSFSSLGKTIKSVAKNVGMSLLNTAAYAAITMAVQALYKYVIQAGERLDEAANKNRESWQQTTAEIEKLNGQLEANKTRIEEINTLKMDGLSYSETELQSLLDQNVALESQIKLKRMIADVQQRAAEVSGLEARS